MTPDAFFARMHGHGPSMALATPARVLSYNALSDAITEWRARFRGDGVAVGDCIAFNAAFTPASVSVFLALVAERCVAVPLCFSERDGHDRMCRMACVSAEYRIAEDGATDFWRREGGDHPLLQTLRGRGGSPQHLQAAVALRIAARTSADARISQLRPHRGYEHPSPHVFERRCRGRPVRPNRRRCVRGDRTPSRRPVADYAHIPELAAYVGRTGTP
jgi:non-ribosomal peptide synthetase component E (peptide arylation enzyme)